MIIGINNIGCVMIYTVVEVARIYHLCPNGSLMILVETLPDLKDHLKSLVISILNNLLGNPQRTIHALMLLHCHTGNLPSNQIRSQKVLSLVLHKVALFKESQTTVMARRLGML